MINSWTGTGRLTKDPALRATGTGKSVALHTGSRSNIQRRQRRIRRGFHGQTSLGLGDKQRERILAEYHLKGKGSLIIGV